MSLASRISKLEGRTAPQDGSDSEYCECPKTGPIEFYIDVSDAKREAGEDVPPEEPPVICEKCGRPMREYVIDLGEMAREA